LRFFERKYFEIQNIIEKKKEGKISMGRTAFMFPGQGAQYIGMGKDFYEQIPVCKEMFRLAGEAGGLDVAALCFEENERINITEYTQIAILAAEVAMLRAVEEKGIRPDVTAGLSLGEYGALVAGGVMTPEDVFKIVRKRGIYMQEAVPEGGAMAAVLGLDAKIIEKVCEETHGLVSVANYNCPGQIVITGENGAIQEAVAELIEAGARRCVPLKVSGPFHSEMLVGAGEKLAKELETVTIHEIQIPYIANVTADYVTRTEDVRPLLEKQVSSSVKWQQTIERMLADGVDTFIEIGPGRTLSGFMRKIDRNVKVLNVERVEDLQKF